MGFRKLSILATVTLIHYHKNEKGIISKKEAYIEKHEAQLKYWATKIYELEAKADRADAEIRIKLSKEINKLRNKRDEAEIK